MSISPSADYSSRLFSRGLYGRHHNSRFVWLQDLFNCLPRRPLRVLEIGCYDGRALQFIRQPIAQYDGFDAGFETVDGENPTGLYAARNRFKDHPEYRFHLSHTPDDIAALKGSFDVAICLETFEHIDPSLVDRYIEVLAQKVRGFVFVSVPNEKGLPLLVKSVGGALLGIDRHLNYGPGEYWNSVLGRMDRVQRNEHKGFDYAALMEAFKQHFSFVSCTGTNRLLPSSLQMTVGFVAGN